MTQKLIYVSFTASLGVHKMYVDIVVDLYSYFTLATYIANIVYNSKCSYKINASYSYPRIMLMVM